MSQPHAKLLKIVVMNDCHLVAPGSAMPRIDTTPRFAAALRHATDRHSDADLCVFAGDLADRAEPEAYALFDQMRAGYPVPQCVTIGNHDDRPTFLAHGRDFDTDPHGFVQCRRDIKGHCILVLDSSEPGQTRGGFEGQKLDWVKTQLSDAAQKGLQVIVILHHNPAALQMPVDTYRLDAPHVLWSALDQSGARIMQVIAGHCHISSSGSWGGFPCTTIAGNHHSVEPFLRGRTGQQACFESPAHYGVFVSNGIDSAVHFETYWGQDTAMDPALFPHKMNQAFEDLP